MKRQRDNHHTKTTYGLNVGAGLKHFNAGAHYSKEHRHSQTLANGKKQPLYPTKTKLAVDTEAVQVMANPEKHAKELARDGIALSRMGAAVKNALKERHKKDAQGQHPLSGKETLEAMEQGIENVYQQYTNSKNEALSEVLEHPTSAAPETLAQALHIAAQQGDKGQAPRASWQQDLATYKAKRKKYLLYD